MSFRAKYGQYLQTMTVVMLQNVCVHTVYNCPAMEDLLFSVEDSALTSSSTHLNNYAHHGPQLSRLDSTWWSASNTNNEWIQVNTILNKNTKYRLNIDYYFLHVCSRKRQTFCS